MMRVSALSRWLTQLPLQSRCCELPIVGNRMLSRLVTESATIGIAVPAIGDVRIQLEGIAPVSLPFSPEICAAMLYWLPLGSDWFGPMLPCRYTDGLPGSGG